MTAVDGKEVEETQYSYVKDWYYDQQRLEGPHPPINKNPEFPSVAPGGVNVCSTFFSNFSYFNSLSFPSARGYLDKPQTNT